MAMTNRRRRGRTAPTNAIPPVLPPTVEMAYKRKCVELKRRMTEVEESNDAFRLRKVRLMRGIRKMRLERAMLLETLSKRMKKNGIGGPNAVYDDDSEGSSEGPPTVSIPSHITAPIVRQVHIVKSIPSPRSRSSLMNNSLKRNLSAPNAVTAAAQLPHQLPYIQLLPRRPTNQRCLNRTPSHPAPPSSPPCPKQTAHPSHPTHSNHSHPTSRHHQPS